MVLKPYFNSANDIQLSLFVSTLSYISFALALNCLKTSDPSSILSATISEIESFIYSAFSPAASFPSLSFYPIVLLLSFIFYLAPYFPYDNFSPTIFFPSYHFYSAIYLPCLHFSEIISPTSSRLNHKS